MRFLALSWSRVRDQAGRLTWPYTTLFRPTLLRWRALIPVAAALFVCCSENSESRKREHLKAADAYFEAQQYGEAIIEYQSALAIDAFSAETRRRLARSYERAGELDKALQQYVRAADLLPTSADAQVDAGRLLVRSGQFEDAKARAEKALASDPRHLGAHLLLGSALVGLRDLDGAIHEVEEAIALEPLEPLGYTSLGMLQIATGDADRAERAFLEAVRLRPESVDVRISLASFYWLARRSLDAENTLKQALNLGKDNALAHRALIALYVQSGRLDEAEPYLHRLAELDSDINSKLALADLYTGTRRFAQATELLRTLKTDRTATLEVTARLAAIAYADQRTIEAHRLIDDLISKHPLNASLYVLKARFLIAENRPDAAIDQLKQAINTDTQSATAYFLLANAYSSMAQYAAAANAYREVLRITPRAAAVQLPLSQVSLMAGDVPMAVQAAEAAVRAQPTDHVAHLVLTDALLAGGELERADLELQALKVAHSDLAAVHLLEGKLLLLKENYSGASRAFSRALTIEPRMVDAAVGLVSVDLASHNIASASRRVDVLRAELLSNVVDRRVS